MNKVLNLRLNRFVPAGLVALVAAVLLAPAPASATPYVVNLVQQGSNVVATGTGEFDLTGLSSIGTYNMPTGVEANPGIVITGDNTLGGVFVEAWSGLTGPTSFGTGTSWIDATTGTGDGVGIDEGDFSTPVLYVPSFYVWGSTFSTSATWDNATFASLGLAPGTYVWTWGSAADQSFTLIISGGMPTVPEPAALGMFGFGVLLIGGFVGLRRRAA